MASSNVEILRKAHEAFNARDFDEFHAIGNVIPELTAIVHLCLPY